MAEVEIDYAAVSSASYQVSTAGVNISTLLGYLSGDATGIDNPGGRPTLRLEVHSRIAQLRIAAADRAESAEFLAQSLDAIHDGYSTLDVALSNEETP